MSHLAPRSLLATLAAATLLAAPLGALDASATAGHPGGRHPGSGHGHGQPEEPAAVLLDWQRTAVQTVYAPTNTPPVAVPEGPLYLGFTSLAVHEAVEASRDLRRSSETAAAAVAAHDVLAHYFPDRAGDLATRLTASLAAVPPGRGLETGRVVGARAADEMIAARATDGRVGPGPRSGGGDPTTVFGVPPAPGVWTPPATGMALPWLGAVEPLVLTELVDLDGPDALTSADYARDYEEVRRLGDAGPTTERESWQTEIAVFFNANVPAQLTIGAVDLVATEGTGLRAAARLFAAMHVSMADSLVTAWRAKLEIGFWRPVQAIAGAADDGNLDTEPEAGWTPLVPNPPYSDYVSGHGSATGPAMETLRLAFGEHTAMALTSNATVPFPPQQAVRTYSRLGQVEAEALHARIWGGLHFREAMVDAYRMGHETARRVWRALSGHGHGDWHGHGHD
jgi:hypothetical protein